MRDLWRPFRLLQNRTVVSRESGLVARILNGEYKLQRLGTH